MTGAVTPRPYWHPYVAGVALGLVLLLTFVVMGHGLGASGAVTTAVAAGVEAVAPAHARANPYFRDYLGDGATSPWASWIVIEVAGILLGGLLSGVLAGRMRLAVERGATAGRGQRLLYAFGGGAVMGIGARLARGCTSGLALTGGAVLSVGAWVFMLAIFAGGYAAAPLFRREWR